MANISVKCLLLLSACAIAAIDVVYAIHDPEYAGIKTKSHRRDPVIAQAFDQHQQQQQQQQQLYAHSGHNYQTTKTNTATTSTSTATNFDANERLSSASNDHSLSLNNHRRNHYQQQEQQQDSYNQQHEIPLYQRSPQERHSRPTPVQQQSAVSSNWDDTENAITEYYTGCPNQHTGPLPYAYDCRRFLNCWNGRGHIQSCAPGTVFNPKTLECDRPEKVACGALLALDEASTSQSTAKYRAGHLLDVSTDNVEMLCPPGVTGLHPHPTDCSKFLNCANGNVHVQNCGPGTAYSIPMSTCDFVHKVDCSGRHGISRSGNDRVPAGTIYDQAASGATNRNDYAFPRADRNEAASVTGDILCPANVTGLFPHPFDYTKFLNCKNGNTAIQNCMLDMVFSISRRYCDTKANVPYTDHATYIVSEVSYEYSQRLTSCPPGTDGQHLYPYDCGRYLKCVDGLMQLAQCAPNTVFSISRRSCLAEQHVVASDRVLYYWELFGEAAMRLATNSNQTQAYNTMTMKCPESTIGLFPFPFDATKYLMCGVNRKLLLETCTSGSVFSLSRKHCHLRDEVEANDMVQASLPQPGPGEEWNLDSLYTYNNYALESMQITCPPGVTGLFLHPFDCTKYFECKSGGTAIESCAPGAVYSISRRKCIARDQVEAFDRVEYLTETENEFSTETRPIWQSNENSNGALVVCPPNAQGLHPHPRDCSKYLRCTNGRAHIESCPPGMVFSISRRSCDYDGQVNVHDRSPHSRSSASATRIHSSQLGSGTGTGTGIGTNTLTAPFPSATSTYSSTDVSCPTGVSGMYPHPRDCTKFLNCDNGVTYVQSCGPGTVWEPRMQVCAKRDSVNCAGRLAKTAAEHTDYEMLTQHVTCPPGLSGFYAHPFDYTHYIVCQDGRTVVQKCFANNVYSISRMRCLPDTEVETSDHVAYSTDYWTETSVMLTQNQFYIACPAGATGTYIYPFDSGKFIKCDNGHTSVEMCAQGKLFSISKHWCTLKDQVPSGDRVNYGTEQQAIYSWESKYGRNAENINCPSGVNGVYQHPYDWTKFLNCTNGQTLIQICPRGKVFSISKRICDTERRVSSEDRCNKGIALREISYQELHGTSSESVSDTKGSLNPYSQSVTCAPNESGMKAYPHDCTKFVKCDNGATHIQDCGPGSAWNIQMQVCDHRQNVDCTDREGASTRSRDSHQAGSLARVSANAIVKCPNGEEGLYSHPFDCTKFLNCASGVTYIQACGPGTAWNSELKVCDFIANVDCSDYNGVEWSTQTDYSQAFRGGKSYTRTDRVQTSQWGPERSDSSSNQQSQNRDRWTIMNVARPKANTLGQEATWSEDRQHTISETSDSNWLGSGSSIRRPLTPSRTVLYEEGSLQPNRNYNQNVHTYSTPLAPLRPGTTSDNTATTTNVYYAQPVGSDEASHETFSRTDRTSYHRVPSASVHTIYQNRQNQGRDISYDSSSSGWDPSSQTLSSHTSTIALPNQNLMPPHRDNTAPFKQHATYTPVPTSDIPTPNQHLMPPHRNRTLESTYVSDHTTSTNPQNYNTPVPNPNLMPPFRSDAREPGAPHQQGTLSSSSAHTISIPKQHLMPPHSDNPLSRSHYPGTITHTHAQPIYSPRTHLMPPSPTDVGQQPLAESEFRVTSVTVDNFQNSPRQFDISGYQDQKSEGSSQSVVTQLQQSYNGPHNTFPSPPTADESNIFGGLQPPLPTSPEPSGTTLPNYLQPATDPTSPVVHSGITERTKVQVFQIYPHLSNATVQQFSRDPHYSPSYSGVAHSHNTNWETAGRKVPQSQIPTEAASNTGDYYRTRQDTASVDGKELPLGDALRMLLRPYFNRSGTASEDSAAKAESYIMNLAESTTNPRPITPTTNTFTPETISKSYSKSTTPAPVADVELILAGEQNSLATTPSQNSSPQPISPNWRDHEHSRDFHSRHPHLPHSIVEDERSSARPDPIHRPHAHRHHSHQHQHSKDFHRRHPHLPNPFNTREGDKSISDADVDEIPNPNAESTTPVNIDLRSSIPAKSGHCQFDCGNNKCVQTLEVCDGVNNCGNRKDESQCDHLGYEVRLTGGETTNTGRVEVKILGKWGYICDDKFGLRDADVVCRELGFKLGASEVRGNSYYPPAEVNFSYLMDEVDCRGNETTLKDCEFQGWGVNNCGPDEVVGVVCKVPQLKCPNNYWLCSTSKECIPPAFVCDNTPDCADKSDESDRICNSTIEYRLEGGRALHEGRLEVKFRGEWGTVCDDDFGLKEAQVFCNSLGFYGKPTIEKNIFGPGSGPIWLDQVSCNGNETTIDKCNHWTWGEHNCNHTEDVGIKCTAGPPPRRTPQTPDTRARSMNDGQKRVDEGQTALEDIGLYSGQWERSSKLLNNQRRCGHFTRELVDEYEHPEERVVNGTVAKRGRHPWQATIRTRGRGGISSHWCGAVLISKKHLLTAAHCLAGYPKGAYFIRLGDHYANIAESSEVDTYIENWYIHEKFRERTHMNNDIALIVLKNPVKFNDYVQPICLPEKGAELAENRLCTISGWGSIKSGISTPSNILRAAQLPILGDATCKQSHVYGVTMTDGMFCAGYMDESVDACDGDSGGPLVCSDADGETLYGIISWGQHCGYANKPGVYVRVEKYIDWIYEKINFSMQHFGN